MNSAATREEELHWRRIDMRAWRRSDDLFELEGRVTDRKPYDFVPANGDKRFPAGEAVHDMGVRLVYDRDLTIHAVATFTEAAPYDACPDGGNALQSLVGLRMASGWSREVRSRLGGERACTHLMELLIPMATTAFQSLSQVNRGRAERVDANGRPLKIDSCYAYGATRELVRVLWPKFHEKTKKQGDA
ncbi:hypothetical protein C7T35_22435 [Variovorax sp. WS11]|uniref:DUF2889 domain-containing protein n=1 Tax=Variovorax sp. WS11 TaxID=1105204 RepID=UPI000D0D6F0B|nr:DUF2889 domain-containing protein [Variovorax sp. WS11]NDZ11841.1 DUF2889 domain-containing protein [Variovorax sp. WS11]PSL82271.1 hypothetical protein C7T35_22435 [Variovorax sp. WS11]